MPAETLKRSPLFNILSADLREAIAGCCRRQTHAAGVELFDVGEPARFLYVLESGTVALVIRTGAREEVIISTISKPGDVFGWSALVEPRILTASAECLAETQLLAIDAAELEALFEAQPQEGLTFMRRLAGLIALRLRDTQNRLISSVS